MGLQFVMFFFATFCIWRWPYLFCISFLSCLISVLKLQYVLEWWKFQKIFYHSHQINIWCIPTSHLLKRGGWTPDLCRKGPIKQGLFVSPSIRPSVCPYVFFGLAHQFFLKLSIMLGTHIQLCVKAGFFGKNLHRTKMVKNGSKTWFLDVSRKSHH